VSIVLAGLVLARRSRIVLWIAGGFCGLAALADIPELTRQVDRSKTGLAVIAGTVAAFHVLGAVAGMVAAREGA
jgi:threonine/homoserine efflux transporter RhtA